MDHASLPRLWMMALLIVAACNEKPPAYDIPVTVLDAPISQTIEPSPSLPSDGDGVQIDVPFSSQAPLGVWDPLHEEACEEMSLLLVHHYLTRRSITPESIESELLALIRFEESHGYGTDVTIAELAKIAREYFGYHPRILDDPTAEELRAELRQGHPVIVPLSGQTIGNPFYSGDGPPYHMLVLTGYTQQGFITNDVGTRRGKRYFYPTNTFMNAIHDWTGEYTTIREGTPRVLVVLP